MPLSHLFTRRSHIVSIAVVVCAAMLGITAIPAHGAEAPAQQIDVPLVGGLSAVDGLESLIDERDGSIGLAVGVGGIELGWDSRAVQAGDRFDLGAGWGFGFRFLDTSGGTRLVTPSGQVFEADETATSGLLGYTLEDLKLVRIAADELSPRVDHAPTMTGDAAYALYELGGRATYFNVDGNPVAQIGPFGERADLQWSAQRPHRLERIVDVDGVSTELDWSSEPGVLVVRRGADVSPAGGAGDGAWRVHFDRNGRIGRIVDPAGGEREFAYDGALLRRIAATTGAITEIEWQALDDQIPRAKRVQVVNHAGRAVTTRFWKPGGAAAPSGWPLLGGADEARPVGLAEFETELSDGSTTARSAYAAQHLLRTRELVGSTAAGEHVLQRQTIEYPSDALTAVGSAVLGSLLSRPKRIETTHVGASGETRSSATEYAYDPSGRVISETSDDGALIETTYDEIVPPGALLAIGLPVRETTSTQDGLVREVNSELNDDRTGVTASETTVAEGPEAYARTVTDRAEYLLGADGFVAEERRFPVGDTAGGPTVTRWAETLDPARGTKSTVETRGVGTDAEASVSETTSLVHGGVIERTDAVGNSSSTRYDVLGRVISRTDPAGIETQTRYETWQRDGRNATVVTTADGVETTEVRDELDRVILRTDNLDHGIATRGHVRTVETIDYDVPGTVRVTDAWGATSSVSHDVFGREVRSVAPSGLTKVTEYDDVAEQVRRGVSPTGRLADAELVTIAHEPTSSLTSRVETSRQDSVDVPESRETVDGLGRAVSATDGFLRTDARYDAFGRPVHSAEGTTYTYDAQNRPVAEVAPDGTVTAFAYWADGARRSLTTLAPDGSTRSTEFTWDGKTLVEETHRADDEITGASYLIGAGRHARTVATDGDTATAYYGTDRHGNVTELTDRDGRISEWYAYSDYGVEAAKHASGTAAPDRCNGGAGDAARNPFRYSGEYTDPSCLQHLAARTYDSATMRFTSLDTAAVMNPFAYTDANPITRVDPTGHMTEEERIWNFIALGIGLAGLAGSGLAFLAPMTRFMTGLVFAAGAGDIVGVASASIREYGRDDMSEELDEDLAVLDIVVGAAIVGFAFGARGVHHWFKNRILSSPALDASDSSVALVVREERGGGGGGVVLHPTDRDRLIPKTNPGGNTRPKPPLSSESGEPDLYTMIGKDRLPTYIVDPTGSKSYPVTPVTTTRGTQRRIVPPARPHQQGTTMLPPANRVSVRGSIQRESIFTPGSGSSDSASGSTPSDPMNVWDTLVRAFS